MTDKGAEARDRRLWRRWQALGEDSRVAEPDALLLAAYAEGRLSEAEAEPVEAWLAAAPEALGDIIAARTTYQRPPRMVFEHVLDKATALVAGEAPPAPTEITDAEILPFRPRLRPSHLRAPHLRPQWRTAIAWSSLAASILCASLVGFSMGSDAYTNLSGTQTADSATGDGFSAPSLDSYFSDDSGT
jgi:anti-sigma factor RsiW